MGHSHVNRICQPWQLAAVHGAVHLGRVPPPIAKRESWKLAHAATTTTTTTDCEQITKHQFPQGRATTTTTTVSTTVESGKMSLMYGVSGIGSTLAVVGACELVPAQPLLDCLRQPRKSVVRRWFMLTRSPAQTCCLLAAAKPSMYDDSRTIHLCLRVPCTTQPCSLGEPSRSAPSSNPSRRIHGQAWESRSA